ncbi:MAG: hypothetical protein ABIY51_13075, partial [Ferruginibacter sp.]
LTVNALPICGITGNNVICVGQSTSFLASGGTSYSWTGPGGFTAATASTGTITAAGTYTVLVTNANGCTSSCSRTLTVNELPVCGITGENVICLGTTTVFTATGGVSYSWTGPGGFTASTAAITVSVAGVYTVTVTNANGCTSSCSRTLTVNNCGACTFTQGAYGNAGGNHCNEDGTTSLSLVKIQRALTLAGGSYTFGRNTRTFTLYYADAIHVEDEMLPGGGNSQMFGAGGATWSQTNTWSRVPLAQGGQNRGKIQNTLFAQTLTMWFNLQNSSSLGGLPVADTIWTRAMTTCGSNIPTGPEAKFGIPHDVVVYLANPANGYTNNVAGLFKLANDVLGGVNTAVSAGSVATAVDVFNNAFDECRVISRLFNLGGTNVPVQNIVTQSQPLVEVSAHPNPYTDKVVFTIRSSVSGTSSFELFGLLGEKVTTLYQGFIEKGAVKTITYEVPNVNRKTLVYQLRIGSEMVTGKVIYPN